jgi:mono/diheme cytochrome c family protein
MRAFLVGLSPPSVVLLSTLSLAGCAFFFGPKARPAPDLSVEQSSAQLERGQYLVEHVSLCVHCHSRRSYAHFGMPPRPGTTGGGGDCLTEKHIEDIPGKLCMPNITPHKEHGIGAWTDGEIARAVREGVDRDGNTVFPMMPYRFFRNMSDIDIAAVITYLRRLAPLDNKVDPSEMGFMVSHFINFVPEPLKGPVRHPDMNDSVKRGEYLTRIAACIECHTPPDGHDLDMDRPFAGGQPSTIKGLVDVKTPNLTPHETGILKMTRAEFIGRFKAFANLDVYAETVDWRKQTIMPWTEYAGMSEDDLGAIYDYLRTVKPVENKVQSFNVKATGPKQEATFKQ